MRNINFNNYRNDYYREKKCQRVKNNMKNINFNNHQKLTKVIFYKQTSFLI